MDGTQSAASAMSESAYEFRPNRKTAPHDARPKSRPATLFTRFLATTVGGVILLTAACLWITSSAISEFSREDGQFHNELLARAIETIIEPELLAWIATAPFIAAEDVPTYPAYQRLEAKLAPIIAEKDILKIEIYRSDGKIVFNNGLHEFGDLVDQDNTAFWEAVSGNTFTELEYDEEFIDIDGSVNIRDSVSSYIPIYLNDKIIGVFEIYSDYSITKSLAEKYFPIIALWVIVGFTALYAVIAFYVWRAQRALTAAWNQQETLHASNARLMIATQTAEQTSKSKSAFLATMSHELRSPLNAVIGFSEEGVKCWDRLPAETLRDYFAQIRDSGASLLALVNAVLDMSRLEAGKMPVTLEAIDPSDSARAIAAELRPVAEKQRNSLSLELPDRALSVLSDELKLRQILRNLIGNALKFTKGGAVVVSVIDTQEADWPAAIIVQDDGVGIAEDQIEPLFEPFNQASNQLDRSHEGAGLGLAIVRQLADLLGCELKVESQVGRGTRFTLTMAATPTQ